VDSFLRDTVWIIRWRCESNWIVRRYGIKYFYGGKDAKGSGGGGGVMSKFVVCVSELVLVLVLV